MGAFLGGVLWIIASILPAVGCASDEPCEEALVRRARRALIDNNITITFVQVKIARNPGHVRAFVAFELNQAVLIEGTRILNTEGIPQVRWPQDAHSSYRRQTLAHPAHSADNKVLSEILLDELRICEEQLGASLVNTQIYCCELPKIQLRDLSPVAGMGDTVAYLEALINERFLIRRIELQKTLSGTFSLKMPRYPSPRLGPQQSVTFLKPELTQALLKQAIETYTYYRLRGKLPTNHSLP